jgi:hypothetical protein
MAYDYPCNIREPRVGLRITHASLIIAKKELLAARFNGE